MPVFAQSQIQLGGYTFPSATRVLARDQPSTVDEAKIPFLDGAHTPPGSRSSKVITLEGTIGGSGAADSTGTLMASSSDAEAELNLLSSYLEAGYQALQFLDITPARTLLVQKRKSTFTPVPGSARQAYDFTIELLAPDPRWLATTATALGPAATLAVNPLVVGGSAPTYPIFTFIGAYVQPYVETFLGGWIKLLIDHTMVGGDDLVIDCDPRNRKNGVVLNGVPRLDLISMAGSSNAVGDSAFFPYLIPGASRALQAASNTGANGTSIAATWREAYLF